MKKIVLGVLVVGVIGIFGYGVASSNKKEAEMEGARSAGAPMMEKEGMTNEGVLAEREDGVMASPLETMDEVPMKKLDEMIDDSQIDQGMTESETMMDKEKESIFPIVSPAVVTPGVYEAYTPDKLSRAEAGDVVLFFKATWCPSCRALDSNISKRTGEIPSDVSILALDYDTEVALKKKYGVTYQHTLVQVDASGNQITKWSGGTTLESVLEKIN